jgi:hypothetical protein
MVLLPAAAALTMLLSPVLQQPPASAIEACVEYWGEVRYRSGYDHWVHLRSSCTTDVLCAVTTDVNPTPIEVPLAPGEHKAVLTWRGSPAYAFTPYVRCVATA